MGSSALETWRRKYFLSLTFEVLIGPVGERSLLLMSNCLLSNVEGSTEDKKEIAFLGHIPFL